MYKHLFGPVPSRRLGISLGVDLVPHKVCSLNCIYCECGPTTVLTLERKEYVSFDTVTKELEHYLSVNPEPDYITFSGAGEPTLNSRLGDVIRFVKNKKTDIPVAVLTNGTLLHQKSVRQELLKADIVIPSLDTVSDPCFLKINRPFHTLCIKEYIQGLTDFRKEYQGKIWLEVLILPKVNDAETDLRLLKEAFNKIQPDLIQLNTLDRPGAVENIHPAAREELERIVSFWGLENVVIIASVKDRKKLKSFRKDTEAAILETIARRPCTIEDLSKVLGLSADAVGKHLDVLEKDQKIIKEVQLRGLFYQTKK